MPADKLESARCGALRRRRSRHHELRLAAALPWLAGTAWRLAVLDEAQAIKNPGAKQTRAAPSSSRASRIALTGTPVENRLSDLWSIFDFINPGLLGSSKAFGDFTKRLAAHHNPYAPLRALVRPYILRRLKTDKTVIADLAGQDRGQGVLPPEPEAGGALPAGGERAGRASWERPKACGARASSFRSSCASSRSAIIPRNGWAMARGRRGRQRQARAPARDRRGHRRQAGESARLHAVPRGDRAARRLPRIGVRPLRPGAARRDRASPGARSWCADSRKTRACRSSCSRSRPGGAGLNLTAASHVVHFDRWWNPAVENQATDRAFRIGQKKNVLVHKFVCRGTVEEKIDALIESKQQLSADLLEGGAELPVDGNERRRDPEARRARSARCRAGRITMFYDWKPYVSVADRQRRAKQALARALRQGTQRSPVMIEGRAIATTFWGKAWCDNIERYSDFYNRLERGRSYVRSGAVLDLQIAPGVVRASVMGSRLYSVDVKIAAVPKARWSAVCKSCFGRDRFAGRTAAGPLLEKRHGAHLPQGDGALSRAEGDHASRAVARTGPRCASTSRRCSTASARASTRGPSCCSRCARSTSA